MEMIFKSKVSSLAHTVGQDSGVQSQSIVDCQVIAMLMIANHYWLSGDIIDWWYKTRETLLQCRRKQLYLDNRDCDLWSIRQ